MKSTLKNSWQGMTALLYVLVVAGILMFVSKENWNHHIVFARVFGLVGWWFPALPLALWGLVRGGKVGKLCGVLAICLEALLFLSMTVFL